MFRALFLLLSVVLGLGISSSSAQTNIKKDFEARRGFLFDVNYSYQQPGGNLADRFGVNSAIGLEALYKSESNWTFGLSYNWIFGNVVIEDNMLDSLVGESNFIIDQDGRFSEIRFNQRGHLMLGTIGKVIPISQTNRNSGILIQVGGGYLSHKVDIYSPPSTVPQLNGEYAKGYDRLTGGMVLSQFIGYQYLDPLKRVNIRAGFSFQQASTKSLRSYDFDTRKYDDTERKDRLSGFRIGIVIPVYTKAAQDEEFFID